MTKTHVEKARVNQTTRFFREGSVLRGTVTGGAIELVTAVEIESGEPPERIRHLVKLAEASCYTMQSLIHPVPVRATATLNGAALDLD